MLQKKEKLIEYRTVAYSMRKPLKLTINDYNN